MPNRPYTLIINKANLGFFATLQDAKAFAERHKTNWERSSGKKFEMPVKIYYEDKNGQRCVHEE